MKTAELHILVSLAAVLVIITSCSHTATQAPAAPESASRFIVQANDMAAAAAAVEQVGGTITHELGIIRAVGATLTPSQIEALSKIDGIKVQADRAVSTTAKPTAGAEVRR